MLDEISRALPDLLWLTEMKQDDSGALTVEGRCANLTSLSDFVGNLERSGYFVKPVEIIDSQVVPAPTLPTDQVLRQSHVRVADVEDAVCAERPATATRAIVRTRKAQVERPR